MARYADGFVMVVPKRNVPAYQKLARFAGKIWIKHGALDYCECVGDDLAVHCGLPFPKMTRLKKGETVVFSWIVYKSRAHRDRVNKKVMADPAMQGMPTMKMPFDVKRMAWGGFKSIVDMKPKKRPRR